MSNNYQKLPVFDIQNIESTIKLLELPNGGIDLDAPTFPSKDGKPAKWAVTISAVANCYTWVPGQSPGPTPPGTKLKWWANFKEASKLLSLNAREGETLVVSRGGEFRRRDTQGPQKPVAAVAALQTEASMATVFHAQAVCLRFAKEALVSAGIQPEAATCATLANSAMIAWERLGRPALEDRSAEAASEFVNSPGSEDIPF